MVKEIVMNYDLIPAKKTFQTTATPPRSMESLDEIGLLLGGSKRGLRPQEKSQ